MAALDPLRCHSPLPLRHPNDVRRREAGSAPVFAYCFAVTALREVIALIRYLAMHLIY